MLDLAGLDPVDRALWALAAAWGAAAEGPTAPLDGIPEPDLSVLEPEVAAGPRIPPTPDVPDTDPADDDGSFAATPGPALRLRALRTSGRRPDPAIAAEARDRVARLLETA